MRKLFSVNYKWIFGGFLTILATLLAVGQVDISLAQSPTPEDDQPVFEVTGQSAPDGSVAIQSQEARLDQAYFAAHGELDGLEVTTAGLTLGEGQTAGVYVSGVIESPLATTTDIVPLWQADLPDGTELRLETRLSLEGGAWSDWVENPEAFYPVRNDQHGGDLIWVGGPQAALQVRVTLSTGAVGVSPALKSLTLAFSDTSDGPTDGEIAAQMADRAESAGSPPDICPAKPPVVPRTEWGCPQGLASPHRPPTYHPVTHVVIHQTETPNRPDPYNDWAGWVRSVWNYHANILWWGDVGYNYLIDPEGVVYEGRAGGDDVVGIHDGVNKGSMAIGFLGCYGDCDDYRLDEANPSPAMLKSAAQLIAWKLGQTGLDPHSSAPYGRREDVPVIAGGRDVTWTSSPGYRLYQKLPYLRNVVKDKIDQCQSQTETCQITEVNFDKAGYTVGDPVKLSVKVVDQDNNPLAGAKVTYDVLLAPAIQSQMPGVDLDLDEAKGVYEGVYVDTQVPGVYLFQITAGDPDGDQFSCFREEIITVEDTTPSPAECQIDILAEPDLLTTPGDPVALTANVTLDSAPVLTANVLATVVNPDGDSVQVDLPSLNDGSYSHLFAETTITGTYNLSATAVGEGFSCGSSLRSFTVEETTPPPPLQCQIDILAEPDLLTTPGDPVALTANVTLDSAPVLTANVLATVVNPDGDSVQVDLPSLNDGSYSQAFTGTAVLGTYDLSAAAAGQGFTCESPPGSFSVPMSDTLVFVEPASVTLCEDDGITATTQIRIAGVTDLQGFDFELTFDPAIVGVVDADPTTEEVEISPSGTFAGANLLEVVNEVVTDTGQIKYVAGFMSPFSGDGVLAEIEWEPVVSGTSVLTFGQVKLSNPDGQNITSQIIDGTIEVITCDATTVVGQIELQGRQDHSGVIVSTGRAGQVQTGFDGSFSVVGSGFLTMSFPGYLSAQVDVQTQVGLFLSADLLDLGQMTMIAGDVTGDDVIDIFDVAYLGARYDSTDPASDLNGDGVVDIFDLTMAADNYGRRGPMIWSSGSQ